MAASLGNATVNVLARTVLFEQSLKRSLKRMSVLTAAVFAGVAGANFFGKGVKDALELERAVARIHTLMGELDPVWKEAFNADAIRDFSSELGISADKVAEATYYMLGSGVQVTKAYDAVRAAAQVAVATNSDLKFSADFVSTALNAYQEQTDKLTKTTLDSAHATDIFFAALAEGKGEPRELAQFMSTAIKSAKGLDISFSEVASAMAAGSLIGEKSRKVATGLSYVMRGLGNDTKGVGKAFKEIAGKDFRQFVEEGGNLQQAIKMIGDAVGQGRISNLGGAETGLESIKLLLTVWDQYVAIQEKVSKASGDATEAIDIVNATASRQVEFLQTRFTNFRANVGEWMLPVIVRAIAAWDEHGPAIKATIVDFFSAIGNAISQFVTVTGPVFVTLWAMFARAFYAIDWAAVKDIITAVIHGLVAGAAPLVTVVTLIAYAAAGLAQALGPVVSILNQMKPLIVGLTAGIVAWKLSILTAALAWKAIFIATRAYLLLGRLVLGVIAVMRTGWLLLQVALGKATLTQWQLNAAMSANPVGAVIALVVALTAAIFYAWKESETFRNIVVGAFNMIKNAVVTAVQVMVNTWLFWAETAVKAMKAVADAAAKLPSWLGGGIAADVSSGLQTILNAIGTIRANVNALADDARAANWEMQRVINLSAGAQGIVDAWKSAEAGNFDFSSSAAVYASLNDGPSIPTMPSTTFGGGGYVPSGGGAGGGSSVNRAKEAAKAAAKKLREDMKALFKDLNATAKQTSKQTISQIKRNFDSLYEGLKEVGKEKYIKQVRKVERKLIDLAKRRDAVFKKLDLRRDELDDIKDKAKDFTNSVKETIRNLGNVAKATDGVASTFSGVRNRLRKAVAETQRFTQIINQLRALKLNDTSLRQLIEAGPEAMDQAAVIARSGSKGVAELNKLQSNLDAAGASLAKTGYDQFYANGIRIAQGLVTGLEKESAAIAKAMDRIADKMVASLKKKLKIKSPSRVFGELGENISQGLAVGIASGGPGVSKAANEVSQTIHFGPGSVSVAGVGDGAAQRAGILTGQGIVQVLRERQVAAQLSGVL